MAFDEAARFLAERFGPDPENWLWGDVHALKLRHRLYGLVPGLGALTGVDLPMGSDRFTAPSGFVFNSDSRAFATVHSPVLRAIVDLSEPVTGYFVILPRQFGNPFLPYYDIGRPVDCQQPVPIHFQWGHIDLAHRLVLTPDVPN